MAYDIILTLHLIGALATGVVAIGAAHALWRGLFEAYKPYAVAIGALAAFETFTGTLLAVVSASLSAAAVCDRIAIYLLALALIEAVLFRRMRQRAISLPLARVLTPAAASIALLSGALLYGF